MTSSLWLLCGNGWEDGSKVERQTSQWTRETSQWHDPRGWKWRQQEWADSRYILEEEYVRAAESLGLRVGKEEEVWFLDFWIKPLDEQYCHLLGWEDGNSLLKLEAQLILNSSIKPSINCCIHPFLFPPNDLEDHGLYHSSSQEYEPGLKVRGPPFISRKAWGRGTFAAWSVQFNSPAANILPVAKNILLPTKRSHPPDLIPIGHF